MRFSATALIKGTEENTKAGKTYRSVLFFGTEGNPADFRASVKDDVLFEKAKKSVYQKMLVQIDLRVYNGMYFFDLLSLEPTPAGIK